MEAEEDMFLVIVGDQTSEGTSDEISAPTSIKPIYLDETEGVFAVENLLEMAERHGEYIDVQVKVEPGELECDNLAEETLLQQIFKSESKNSDDEDYIPEEEDEYDHTLDHDVGQKEGHRYKLLKPEQQKSFVAELRKKYPELNKDQNRLIDTLSEIMNNVRVPKLPNDYYIHNSKKFMCIKCGATTESISAAGRHYQEKHGERYLVCYACGVDFRSTTNLYKHEKRCTAPDAQVVLKARAVFLGPKGRGRPYLSLRPGLRFRAAAATEGGGGRARSSYNKNEKARFACDECSAVFKCKVALQSHQYQHSGERPFRCHICIAAYTSHSALMRHAKKHTNIQFICDHCKRSFKVKSALVTHMDTHRPERKHECLECGRRYAQRAAMLVHVNRDHRNLPPPFACQLCPKRYPRMTLLKDHMKKKHGMTLMTRKMFSKYLPTMTEKEVQQAKVVFRSEAPSIQDIIEDQNPKHEICETLFLTNPDFEEGMIEDNTNSEEYSNNEQNALTDNTVQMDDFMHNLEMMKNNTLLDDKSQKVFVIKNGAVINLNELDESKINLLKDIDSMVEVTGECVEPETGESIRLSMPDL